MGISDGYSEANFSTKISFFLVLLADVVNWIGFCTTSWWVHNDEYQGLWRLCNGIVCGYMDGTPDDDMNAIQAFAIFGFIALNVAFLLINLYMCWGSCKGNGETGVGSVIFLFISAGSWLISVAIFGAGYDDRLGRFGYSYALAVSAGILALLSGFIMLIGGRGNDVLSK
ncbi:epithelial membrane protein 1 [Biomphalaria glabrata]|uniref:Uncharacterized protein LOC106076757 n=1 Tax=Biomphalaria glabrata TaxID=6526 RepID=A0A9U8ELS9_BIOGL|nr:uncharacterized protein LOC106076757 [Biomphalaria glabrata]XP_013093036.2 uncharacterized protein LOC106076757 [Biomphalaria glabrata]KAI8766425.1 epithelial membrane protein 1-like [Biomphalaria glabrata]